MLLLMLCRAFFLTFLVFGVSSFAKIKYQPKLSTPEGGQPVEAQKSTP